MKGSARPMSGAGEPVKQDLVRAGGSCAAEGLPG